MCGLAREDGVHRYKAVCLQTNRLHMRSGACAPDTYSLRAGADPAPSKAAIGAAAGSCVATALAALALLYAWFRRRSASAASAGCFPGAKGRRVMPPGLSVPAGSLTLRVRRFAPYFINLETLHITYRPL